MYLPAWHTLLQSRLIPRTASIIVLVVSSIAFFGWLTDNLAIKSVFSGINPVGAFVFILLSSALLLLTSGKALLAQRVLIGIAALISFRGLAEVVFSIDTGIHQLFVITRLFPELKPFAPNTTLAILLLAFALLFNQMASLRAIIIAQTCALLVLLIASLALAGHIYDLRSLYTIAIYPPMSLSTAVMLIVFCLCLLTVNSNRGLMAVFVSPTSGGAVARRLIPLAILTQLILGGLQVQLGRAELYSDQSDVIVFVTLTIMAAVIIIWWTAQAMDRADSARKQVEEALGINEVRYRALFENSSDAILIFDEQGRYIDANTKAEHLTGYSHDEILRLNVGDMTPQRQADLTPKRLNAVRNQENLFGEGFIVRKDGSELMAELSAVSIASGLYQLIIRDISVRKEAEQALRISEARYRALFESSHDGIMIFDEEGRYLDANSQAERLTGYSREEILERRVGGFAMQPVEGALLFSQIKSTGRLFRDYSLARKDGSEVAVEFSAIAVGGGLYQTIYHDISERKQTEVNLRRSLEQERHLNELKTRFMSLVSHDFRTPLAVILSSTDLLLNYSERMDTVKRTNRLETIRLQVGHMVEMLENLLSIGKAETVGLEFKAEHRNLEKFCADLVSEYRLAVPDHTIVFNGSDDCGDIICDPKLLRPAILNLLSNATKYSPESEPVLVDLVCKDAEIVIRVQDHGIGVPEEDQQHMFELFHRAGNVGDISGTGLGLLIVKQAIEAHQGTIKLESKPNVGTTFTICLPRQRV